ncbi:MAG: hypothetical protein ABGY75_02140, partial [Gemmataceae bacterium]
MPRVTNVPYHQNVYDLLDLEPGVCPVASRMIADHEAEFGPLPASVREWYSVPKMVPLEGQPQGMHGRYSEWQLGMLWYDYSNDDPSVPLAEVLEQFSRSARGLEPLDGDPRGYVLLKIENQQCVLWRLKLDDDGDPPVYSELTPSVPSRWDKLNDHFSDFTWWWFQHYHGERFTPLSTRQNWEDEGAVLATKPNENTHWLCTPATPYPVPLIDYLIDHLGDPDIRPVPLATRPQSRQYATDLFGDPVPYQSPSGVSQFTFTSDDGLIRLTTDNLDHPNPHAAWWIAGH